MVTWLQQLVDDLAAKAHCTSQGSPMEDVAGALGHLGRALTRLAEDGLTVDLGPRERGVAGLGRACAVVGGLWPPAGGPLTDLAGAAADLAGRDRSIMGRAHRWAITVEFAAVADECARLGRHLLPQAAVAELAAVRRLAAAVERDAQTDPPTAAGSMILDRLIPGPGSAHVATDMTALDVCASLAAALDRAHGTGELTLREFRAAVAAAEITSRYATAISAASTNAQAAPPLMAAAAWRLTGRVSMTFQDGRRTGPSDPRGVIPMAQALAGALRADIGADVDIAALRDREDLPTVVRSVQEVTHQLPLLAERLGAVVDHWSRNGGLVARARDLPPMEDMPEDRVRAVITGRRVQARGHDLVILGQAVRRAGALSTALADSMNGVDPSGTPGPTRLVDRRRQLLDPGTGERLVRRAQAVTEALAATNMPLASPPVDRHHVQRPGF